MAISAKSAALYSLNTKHRSAAAPLTSPSTSKLPRFSSLQLPRQLRCVRIGFHGSDPQSRPRTLPLVSCFFYIFFWYSWILISPLFLCELVCFRTMRLQLPFVLIIELLNLIRSTHWIAFIIFNNYISKWLVFFVRILILELFNLLIRITSWIS